MPGITIQIMGDGAGAAEALRVIEERMKQTEAKGREMGEQLAEAGERVKHALEMAGIGLGVQEVVERLREAVSTAGEFGEAIMKANKQTGIAADTLSVLHYAAGVTGSDFDQLVSGVSRLGKNMGEAADGNDKLSRAFSAAGINARELVGRSDGVEVAFRQLGKTLAATESPARRNQLVIEMLGKAGAASIPVITELAEHFDQFKQKAIDAGVYLDKMSAQQLQQLNQRMADLKQRVEGAEIAFSQGLTPAVSGIADAFKAATKGTDLWEAAGKNAGVLALGLAGAFQQVSSAVRAGYDDLLIFAAEVDKVLHYQPEFLIPKDQQKAYEEHQAYAQQTIDSARAEHDQILKDERDFTDKMVALQNQLLHPEPTTRAGRLIQYLRDAREDGSAESDGKGFAGAGASHDDPVAVIGKQFSALQSYVMNNRAWIREYFQSAAREAKEEAPAVWDKIGKDAVARVTEAFKTAPPVVNLRTELDDPLGPTRHPSEMKQQGADESIHVISGFMDGFAEQASRGKVNFRELVDSALADLDRWAMGIVEKEAIIPALNALFGINQGPNFNSDQMAVDSYGKSYAGMMAGGGSLGSGDWAIVGDSPSGDMSNAEAFAPSGPGTVLPHDVLEGIAKGGGGGGGGAPSVVIHNTNNATQPVAMKSGGVSWDSDAKQFIIHTVLEDASNGGPVASMMGGFQRG